MDRVARPYLLPIRINGIACDADAIGGPSSIYGYGEPADDQDSRRGPRLNLHIQGGIGRAWEEGTQTQSCRTLTPEDTAHFATSLETLITAVSPSPTPQGLACWVLQSVSKPADLLGVS